MGGRRKKERRQALASAAQGKPSSSSSAPEAQGKPPSSSAPSAQGETSAVQDTQGKLSSSSAAQGGPSSSSEEPPAPAPAAQGDPPPSPSSVPAVQDEPSASASAAQGKPPSSSAPSAQGETSAVQDTQGKLSSSSAAQGDPSSSSAAQEEPPAPAPAAQGEPPPSSSSAPAVQGEPSASASAAQGAPVEEKVSFLVQFLEFPVSFVYEARADELAEDAVYEAGLRGLTKFSANLGVSSLNLGAFPTYPTSSLTGLKLTVSQWFRLGNKPFIAVTASPNKPETGFSTQRDMARAQLKQSRDLNNALVKKGLPALTSGDSSKQAKEGKQIKIDDGCRGCQMLSAAVQVVQHESEMQKAEISSLKTQISDMNTVINDMNTVINTQNSRLSQFEQTTEALMKESEKMRKVWRRIIVEQVRLKAVERLGTFVSKDESWSTFFTIHAIETKALGISDLLFSLLVKGKKVLHKTVHEATLPYLADCVLSIKENTSERRQFEEAFRFAFDEDVSNFFMDDEDY